MTSSASRRRTLRCCPRKLSNVSSYLTKHEIKVTDFCLHESSDFTGGWLVQVHSLAVAYTFFGRNHFATIISQVKRGQ